MKASTKNLWLKRTYSLFRAVLLIGLSFVILYPLLLKVAISLRSAEDILDSSIILLPKHYTFNNLANVMDTMNYWKAFGNTVLICTLSGLLHVFSCTLVAYSLAKFQFPGKKLVYVAVILTFFVPPQLLSVPIYTVFKNFDLFGFLQAVMGKGLNLLDKPVSLLLLYGTANALKSGLYIYLLIQFFRNMPRELDEAAAVDGASNTRTLLSIALPNAKVMLVTVFLFTFVWQWTDLQYAAMFFQNFEVLSTKLSVVGQSYALYLQSQGTLSTPLQISQIVSAGSIVFLIPLLILYLFCNRFFVQGIERSGIVG